jgi:hypothetical protein
LQKFAMPVFPRTVSPCIDEAVARAARMLDHAVDHAVEKLEEDLRRKDSAEERQALASAVRELLGRRPMWRLTFAQALRKAIDAPPPAAKPAMTLRPSSLTLVDDSVVTQSIEASRLQQEVAALVEQPLTELNALMSSALDLDAVQPEANPLRPEVFTHTLRDLMNEQPGQPQWPALWMRHMAQPLAADLKELYKSCSQLLKQARVQAAGYRVVTAPGALAPRASQPAPLPSAGVPLERATGPAPLGASSAFGALGRGVSAFAEFAAQAFRGPMFRDFLSGNAMQEQEQQPLPPGYYAHVDREMQSVEAGWTEAAYDRHAAHAYEELPPVDRPARRVSSDSPLDDQRWGAASAPRERSRVRTRLKKEARQVGQAIGVEVVRQMVDQVARDERLLAPVREAIVALEPSLGRLAMAAPRFFGQEDHAGRRLVEGIAQRSFKYNDEFGEHFEDFLQDVSAEVQKLNAIEQIADAAPFDAALGQLKQRWAAQDQAEGAQRQRVMEAVRFAEKRQAESEQIAWGLSQRSDLDGVPGVVQDFLFGPWSLVMAHAKLVDTKHEMDPGGYIAVITDLLWSVKRDQTLRDPARAFERIPRVLMKLRAGLDLIGHTPAESDTFFSALERLHRPVLKLRAKHRQQSFESATGPSPLDDDDLAPEAAHKPEPPEELWLAPDELNACGFEDTLPSDYATLAPDEPRNSPDVRAAAPRPPMTEAEAQTVIGTLREGMWVDLYSRQKWRRAQLVWSGSRGTLYMFVSHGGRPHSMTRRSLQRLVLNRLVRPVDSQEVVQHAIDALARAPAPAQPLAA